jgi:hypothetical protein
MHTLILPNGTHDDGFSVNRHAVVFDVEREDFCETARILSSLGSPKPSRSTSRVARWGLPVQSVKSTAPFSTNRAPWRDFARL